jgi:hypothetical protein
VIKNASTDLSHKVREAVPSAVTVRTVSDHGIDDFHYLETMPLISRSRYRPKAHRQSQSSETMHSFYTTVIKFYFSMETRNLGSLSRWWNIVTHQHYIGAFCSSSTTHSGSSCDLLRYLRPPPMIRTVWPKIFLITFHWIPRSPCSPKAIGLQTPRVSSWLGRFTSRITLSSPYFFTTTLLSVKRLLRRQH